SGPGPFLVLSSIKVPDGALTSRLRCGDTPMPCCHVMQLSPLSAITRAFDWPFPGARCMQLYWRVVGAVCGVVTVVLALFAFLAVLQFSRVQSELERDRFAILSDRIAAPFDSAARIGLPL